MKVSLFSAQKIRLRVISVQTDYCLVRKSIFIERLNIQISTGLIGHAVPKMKLYPPFIPHTSLPLTQEINPNLKINDYSSFLVAANLTNKRIYKKWFYPTFWTPCEPFFLFEKSP